jgi:CRP-like cAMP-binding protein
MTAEELRKLEAHYQRGAKTAEDRRIARNAAVRQALKEGMTHAQIAEATGLTRGRISQIR